MKNDYEINGNVTTIIINSPKYGIVNTLVDTDDLPKVKKIVNWHVAWSEFTKSFYVRGYIRKNGKRKLIRLHRYVMGVTDSSILVDHIHRNTLDNRKSKLKVVTHLENNQNSGMYRSNSSGTKGVSLKKETNKWQAYIAYEGKQKHLGYFDEFNEAVKVREQAEKEVHLYNQYVQKERDLV